MINRMCDRILMIENGIRTTESQLHYFKKLLKVCEENKSKGYNCALISEQLSKKEKDMELFIELRKENVALCNLYHQLEKELNRSS
jgi:hypothetical protein